METLLCFLFPFFLPFRFIFYFIFSGAGDRIRALYMLNKHSTLELHPWPLWVFFFFLAATAGGGGCGGFVLL